MMKNNFISASVNITDMDDEAKKYPIVTKVEKDVTPKPSGSPTKRNVAIGAGTATLTATQYQAKRNEEKKKREQEEAAKKKKEEGYVENR